MVINYQHDAFMYLNPVTGEYDERENEEGILRVKATYSVCSRCHGHGTHFRSDLDENRLIDNMREDGDDEGIEAYYSGAFDEVCEECNGNRVVAQPILPEWAKKVLDEWYEYKWRSKMESEAERMMGC